MLPHRQWEAGNISTTSPDSSIAESPDVERFAKQKLMRIEFIILLFFLFILKPMDKKISKVQFTALKKRKEEKADIIFLTQMVS